MRSTWNKQTPVDQERQALNEILMDLDSFRRWAASNPKFKALPDGLILQQITEEKWTARATADNASDRPIAQNSVMSGYKVAETGQMIMQKLADPMLYTLPEKVSEAPQTADKVPEPAEDDSNLPFNSTAFLRFSDVVAGIESSGDYGAIGGYNNHYLGKYQMGKAALKDVGIGYTKADREAYLADPDAQDDAFEQFTLMNHNYLKARSQKYRELSEREQLAVLGYAHNQGRGGALRFLQTGEGQTDGFGTEATKYADAIREALG